MGVSSLLVHSRLAHFIPVKDYPAQNTGNLFDRISVFDVVSSNLQYRSQKLLSAKITIPLADEVQYISIGTDEILKYPQFSIFHVGIWRKHRGHAAGKRGEVPFLTRIYDILPTVLSGVFAPFCFGNYRLSCYYSLALTSYDLPMPYKIDFYNEQLWLPAKTGIHPSLPFQPKHASQYQDHTSLAPMETVYLDPISEIKFCSRHTPMLLIPMS